MICPVCRSQNLETAKFCGNCGSPFPRTSQPSPSLVNCDRGHVYSAVYDRCPYCPQTGQTVSQADFATRIETAIEVPGETCSTSSASPPSSAGTEQMRRDYATRIDTAETGVESPPGSQPSFPAYGEQPRRDYATVVEPMANSEGAEPITFAPNPAASSSVEPIAVVPALGESSTRVANQPAPETAVPAPPPLPSGRQDSSLAARLTSDKEAKDRRTIVVPDVEAPLANPTQGRLIGWVVTFYRDPNGEDFRLQAGRNILGASPNCDIVIDDEAVSGLHASIIYRHGRCYIKDELSTNGTFVNGVEIEEPRPLQNYDEIRIGNVSLTFVAFEPAA